MAGYDWHKLRFLESTSNLKPLVKARTGRTLNSASARALSVCLQQGRLFLDSAAKGPLEIRPLLLFYGQVGLAKALTIAWGRRTPSGLPKTHGLTDLSPPGSKLQDLQVRINESGTFNDYNNICCTLMRLSYWDTEWTPVSVYMPGAASVELEQLTLSLREILSRIPGLEDLYQATFDSPANVCPFQIYYFEKDYFELTVWNRVRFSDRDTLRELVGDLRTRYPLLQHWHFHEATIAHGKSCLTFDNLVPPDGSDEFGDDLILSNTTFESKLDGRNDSELPRMAVKSILTPVAAEGPSGYIIAPYEGHYISHLSYHYLALFTLSSLVRYRPESWVNALASSSVGNQSADDQMVALIELCLERSGTVIPESVVSCIKPDEDEFS
jgi:hypothetical protein